MQAAIWVAQKARKEGIPVEQAKFYDAEGADELVFEERHVVVIAGERIGHGVAEAVIAHVDTESAAKFGVALRSVKITAFAGFIIVAFPDFLVDACARQVGLADEAIKPAFGHVAEENAAKIEEDAVR